MKYITTFEKFDIKKEKPDLPLKTDMTLFNNSEVNINDFKKRKDQLSQIYMNYKEDDKPVQGKISTDLYNKLLSGKFINPGNTNNIQFTNPLFAQHAELLTKQRQTKNIEDNLNTADKNIQDTNKNIQDNIGSKEANDDNIKNQTDSISKQKKDLDKVEKDSNDLQKSSQKQIQNNIKDLETAKKRITNLSAKK